MNTAKYTTEDLVNRGYKYGFVTEIEADTVPRGLNEEIIGLISAKKNEPDFTLEWRFKAYRHWVKLEKSQAEPKWANVHYPPIDYPWKWCPYLSLSRGEQQLAGRTRGINLEDRRESTHLLPAARHFSERRG